MHIELCVYLRVPWFRAFSTPPPLLSLFHSNFIAPFLKKKIKTTNKTTPKTTCTSFSHKSFRFTHRNSLGNSCITLNFNGPANSLFWLLLTHTNSIDLCVSSRLSAVFSLCLHTHTHTHNHKKSVPRFFSFFFFSFDLLINNNGIISWLGVSSH